MKKRKMVKNMNIERSGKQVHYMHLNDKPYSMIASGQKTIELRLYDEKRKKIHLGDTIIFANLEIGKKTAVKVKNIYTDVSFQNLFKRINNNSQLGFADIYTYMEMANMMREYYSEEQEKKYGVIAIEFDSPKIEVAFPIETIPDEKVKYNVVISVYDNQIVFCQKENSDTWNIPGGHVEKGETVADSAVRELWEETGAAKIKGIIAIGDYYACDSTNETRGAYGRVFYAELSENLPVYPPESYEMANTQLMHIDIEDNSNTWISPDFTHFEIYSVILDSFIMSYKSGKIDISSGDNLGLLV